MVLLCTGFHSKGQGILDSLVPNSDSLQIEETSPLSTTSTETYLYKDYIKDSLKLQQLADSLSRFWQIESVYDLPKSSPHQDFDKKENLEFNRSSRKKMWLTFFVLFTLVLTCFRQVFFNTQIREEYGILRGNFALNEWLESHQTFTNFYFISSKLLNYFILSSLVYAVMHRTGIEIDSSLAIKVFVFIALFNILKHLNSLIFSLLIKKLELFKLHFSTNHLFHSLSALPLILLIFIGYTFHITLVTNWLLIICASIVVLSLFLFLTTFTLKSIFSTGVRNVYLIFYLCTFEILPIILCITWLAKTPLL